MAPALDVNNPANWQLIYTVNLHTQTIPTTPPKFHPLPIHVIPVTSATRILAVGANSIDAQSHWRLAFYLISSIQIPEIGKADVCSFAQFLGLNLYRIPNLHDEYFLRIKFPPWHKSMDIEIFSYVGTNTDDDLDGGDVI